MFKNAAILTFRKLRSQWRGGTLFIGGLVAGYTFLVYALSNAHWLSVLGAMVILTAIVFSGYPMISKKEFGLHKIYGANKNSILPLIIIQSIIIALIVSLSSLALIGFMSDELITNIRSVVYSDNTWLFPVATSSLATILCALHLRIFSISIPSISNKH